MEYPRMFAETPGEENKLRGGQSIVIPKEPDIYGV